MDAEKWSDAVAEIVREFVERKLGPLEQRIRELEAERHKTMADSFAGAYSENLSYRRGMVCQHRGGLWLCMQDSREKPGGNDAWKLLLRRPE